MATARLFKKQANEISSKWLSSAHQFLPKDGIDICSVLLKKYSAKNLELEDLLNSIEEICLSYPNLISAFLHLFYDRPLLDDSSSLNGDSLPEHDVSSVNSSANSLVAEGLPADLPEKESLPDIIEITQENIDPLPNYNQGRSKADTLPPISLVEKVPQQFYRPQPPIKLVEKVVPRKVENVIDSPTIPIATTKNTVNKLPPISLAIKTTGLLPIDLPPPTLRRAGSVPSIPATQTFELKRKFASSASLQDSNPNSNEKKKYSAKNDKKRTAEEQDEINKKLQLASQLIANVLSERISPNGSKKKKAKKAVPSNLL
jgi:hypothetical protein